MVSTMERPRYRAHPRLYLCVAARLTGVLT
jgi:hypothetical protein